MLNTTTNEIATGSSFVYVLGVGVRKSRPILSGSEIPLLQQT